MYIEKKYILKNDKFILGRKIRSEYYDLVFIRVNI